MMGCRTSNEYRCHDARGEELDALEDELGVGRVKVNDAPHGVLPRSLGQQCFSKDGRHHEGSHLAQKLEG